MRARDRKAPASFLTIEEGTEVVDRFGASIGPVERVLTWSDEYFDGLIVNTPVGRRFVDAPEVRRVYTTHIELSITLTDVEYPGEPKRLGAHSARLGRTEATEDDRHAVIDALKWAYVNERIDTDELAELVGRSYSAHTLDELERLIPEP